MGNMCVAASNTVVYVHSSEVFPTSVRNASFGLLSMSARVGGILAPFLNHFFAGGSSISQGGQVIQYSHFGNKKCIILAHFLKNKRY